jgi:hypothetical protein
MEIRATLGRLGPTLIDPTTGRLSYDTVKLNALYQDTLTRGDTLTLQALEERPPTCPIEPALLAKGRAQRLAAVDPVAAKKLQEMEAFQAAMDQARRDALRELPLAAPDPMAAMTAGQSVE